MEIEAKIFPPISIIVPALNEAGAIQDTVKSLHDAFAEITHEVIVVDDGSSDETGDLACKAGAKVLRHPVPGGYGNALKAGIAAAEYDVIAITDADATYPIKDLPKLYTAVTQEGFHMAVGKRTGKHYHGGLFKNPARKIFTFLSEFSTGRTIPDVNSGMRVFRKQDMANFYNSLCNGFSFTTTITLAYMLNGYFIKYIPISYFSRQGKSKVRHFKDSLGSLQIIAQAIIYYNPLKIFLVLAFFQGLCFLLSMLIYFVSPLMALLFFLFAGFSTLVLAFGFLATGISSTADLARDSSRQCGKHSHFIANIRSSRLP